MSVAGHVLIPENNSLPAERSVFRGNFGNRAPAQPAPIHHRDGAEIAHVRTSPCGKEDPAGQVSSVKERFARHGDGSQRLWAGAAVNAPPGSSDESMQELFPEALRFAD